MAYRISCLPFNIYTIQYNISIQFSVNSLLIECTRRLWLCYTRFRFLTELKLLFFCVFFFLVYAHCALLTPKDFN